MIYRSFQNDELSMLGFGAMRLPQLENGAIDEAQVFQMVDYAIEHGVNYFDTAYPYHGGRSELVIGRALARHPRDSWRLATKYPGHQIADTYNPAEIFEEQLDKCGVDYFDYYLLHNIYENSLPVYLDERWGIIDYFVEQKRRGRIRHLGFSVHGSLELMREFLDKAGEHMEFCQIQLNWLDWTLQDAKSKVDLLNERAIPIWVMEPLRGGRLCDLGADAEAELKALRSDEGIPAWSFRFLQGVPGVVTVLSGMSTFAQVEDNIATFGTDASLDEGETGALFRIAEGMKDSVPCTACRYCTPSCPAELDIPALIEFANELRFAPSNSTTMRLEALPEDKQPAACTACGTCELECPQGIAIPEVLADLARRFDAAPKWKDMSRERAAEEAALRESMKRG